MNRPTDDTQPLISRPPMPGNELSIYTVYNNPTDYPGKFVVRRYVSESGRTIADFEPLLVCDTLDQARAAIPTSHNICTP